MKYIICEDFSGQSVPFLFPDKVAHLDMREQLPYGKIVSGGYAGLVNGRFICSGGDAELGISARLEDNELIQDFFTGANMESNHTIQGHDPVLDPASTPETIETRSFAIIDAEAGADKPFRGPAWQVARRLVHTAGDLSLLTDLVLPDAAVEAGIAALRKGAPVFTDTEMARAGVPRRRTDQLGVTVTCILSRPEVAEAAREQGITRAKAGVLALGERMGGAIVAIGNAPTALLAVVEYVDAGGTPPALVIGMPVGFVNAAESKELLLRRPAIASLVVRGRRGGSPMAAAAVNALANLALER